MQFTKIVSLPMRVAAPAAAIAFVAVAAAFVAGRSLSDDPGAGATLLLGACALPAAGIGVVLLLSAGLASAWRRRVRLLEIRLRESADHLLNVDADLRDAMERLAKVQRRSAENEHKLRSITDNLPVLILYIDSALHVQFCNATLEDWMGQEPDCLLGRPLADTIAATVFGDHGDALHRVLAGERVALDVQCRTQAALRDLHTICVPDHRDGTVEGMFALTTDVSATKQLTRDLERLSRVDTLTGLPNRRQLDEHVPEAIMRARRSRKSLALFFLDIDRFKSINDTWGHAAGDRVIAVFGARVAGSLRETDFVARLAGDEFVAVVEDLRAPDEAMAIARKIVAAIARPMTVDGHELSISTSIGIALYGGREATLAALLRAADKALYEAKAAGGNCIRVAK